MDKYTTFGVLPMVNLFPFFAIGLFSYCLFLFIDIKDCIGTHHII